MFMSFLQEIISRFRGEWSTKKLIKHGMVIGKNFERLNNVLIDDSHCWLIEIGDNVTLAPRVHILAHDASTKMILGYTKIGCVKIGNNVFVGAESVILPGVKIGNNVIIGANSTVTHDIPDNTVVAGSPAKPICTLEEYLEKERKMMEHAPVFGKEYTLGGGIDAEKKAKQKDALSTVKNGFVI